MHLNASRRTIVQSRTRANVQHPVILRPSVLTIKHRKTHSIHSAIRNQLVLRIHLNVCSRETESAPHAETADHYSVHTIIIAENTVGALHITIEKQAPRLRRTEAASFAIATPLITSNNLNAKFLTPSYVVIKLSITVMPEPMVIAHHQHLNAKLITKNLLHELSGRHQRHLTGKIKHHNTVNAALAEQSLLLACRSE